MKIAVSADGSSLNANVASRLGTAEYILIIDLDTGTFEAVPNPGRTQQRGGAGIQAIVLAVSKGVNAVLTGYCSPAISSQLISSGIEILTGISGSAAEAAEKYKKSRSVKNTGFTGDQPVSEASRINKDSLVHAAKSSSRQFANLLPVLISVVLLMGLFNAFVSRELLSAIFSGNPALDTLLGACFGSIFAGNPINSYIIGGELLKHGVSLMAVTAFIIAWVTVGSIQLPAEIAALGCRFALLRNAFSFITAIIIAILTVMILKLTGIFL